MTNDINIHDENEGDFSEQVSRWFTAHVKDISPEVKHLKHAVFCWDVLEA